MLSGALAVLDISLLGLQIIINLFCVLPPVSVMYRHAITFLKCIHYFSSETAHYSSRRVQGNLHCTHVMVYTDHCTFTKVCAICSLAFIINELVIWSLFHCLIVLSPGVFERHHTVVNRILNSDSGLFATPLFFPRPFDCTISMVLPPPREQDTHKIWVCARWGFFGVGDVS